MICDFAQYYHVLDWRSLPVRLAATLAAGLPPESRSKMHLAGQEIPLETQIRAAILDNLRHIDWVLCGGQGKGPDSLLDALRGETADEDGGLVQSFDSPEEYEAAMRAAEGGVKDGKRD